MPISPVVQQHQRSIVQQSNTPEQLSFNKEFGDAAYELLGAKFPRLLPYVVTFKILDHTQEDSSGSGIGAFILSRGQEVQYLPVILQGGSIVSCEMVYNKEEDSFAPLIPKEVKAIVNANMTQDHSLVNNPHVEDTHEVYRSMFRPPISSRPILASSGNLLESLPDEAKSVLSAYLTENPETLGKIASFYPIEALAAKLAVGSDTEKEAGEKEIEEYKYLDKVVVLDTLTKEAAELLSDDTKAEVLDKGYAITEEPEAPAGVIPSNDILQSAEKVFNATEISGSKALQGTGNLMTFNGKGFTAIPCILSGNVLVTAAGCGYIDGSLVVSNFKEGLALEDLKAVAPFVQASTGALNASGENSDTLVIAVPKKDGSFKLQDKGRSSNLCKSIDGVLWIEDYGQALCFTPAISHGRICNDRTDIYPAAAYVLKTKRLQRNHTRPISTFQELANLIKGTSVPLQLKKDGPDLNLIDRHIDKTAQFKSEPELVAYLISEYNFGKEATEMLLEHKKVHLIKHAYSEPMGTSEQPSASMWSNTPQMPQQEDEAYVVDESMVDDMAEFEDPDMMDTGLVGSLANSDDIKSLLVDSRQSFSDTTTELGKSVLLFAMKKEEMEAQYGREEYSSVAHNLRTGFSTLGGLVFDLNTYINNRSYSAEEA